MIEIACRYAGDRDAALVGLLYEDLDPAERAAFEAHVATCARCHAELDALSGVRDRLAGWTPPYPARILGQERAPAPPARRWAILRDMPMWAQAAAALLVVGVAASIANLTVRYDGGSVTVRTGWMTAGSPEASASGAGVSAPWRGDLAALERQLQREMRVHAESAAQAAPARASQAADADLLRRVRAMVEDSERRQQRELALRLAEIVRDVDTQRRADLVKIDRSLGLIQNDTGVEVLRQREMLNYLMRASQKQ